MNEWTGMVCLGEAGKNGKWTCVGDRDLSKLGSWSSGRRRGPSYYVGGVCEGSAWCVEDEPSLCRRPKGISLTWGRRVLLFARDSYMQSKSGSRGSNKNGFLPCIATSNQ